MATYEELTKKIEELKKQAEQVRCDELKEVIAEIRQKMAQYGVTAADLEGPAVRRTKRKGGKAKVKYRDPTTGHTWAGRGRPPRWLVEAEKAGKERNSFLV